MSQLNRRLGAFILLVLLTACWFCSVPSSVKATTLQTHVTEWDDLDDSWAVTVNSAYHVRLVNNMTVSTEMEYLMVIGFSDGGMCWHVYWYEVRFACPKCEDKRGIMAYAPEMKKIEE